MLEVRVVRWQKENEIVVTSHLLGGGLGVYTPVSTVPFNFVTREFENIVQRTIKIKLETVYRMELHFVL